MWNNEHLRIYKDVGQGPYGIKGPFVCTGEFCHAYRVAAIAADVALPIVVA